MQEPISITALGSISALGASPLEVWNAYRDPRPCFNNRSFPEFKALVSEIPTDCKKYIITLRKSENRYKALDDTVLLALYASRQAVKKAGWNAKDNFGVNIGSSRGATGLFENYHREFIHSKSADVLTSPTTTLGNISSWVAHDLQTQGPEISHSITCSTALHALMNGIAWIQSGMCDKFLVGGSESPLTAFTIAQMRALHIYAQNNGTYPCRTLDLSKNKNTMILGEGAAMACIESGRTSHAMALIAGIGYATEILEHSASLSSNADCFQRSMRMALAGRDPGDIDIIITHSPGTIKGDQAEIKAIKRIFGDYHPALTTNKWKLGHTLGASGMLSIEMAVLMLKHQEFVQIPWMNQSSPSRIQNIMVNAVGFGGNAVSVLLKRSG